MGLFDLLLGSLKSLGPVKTGEKHKATPSDTRTRTSKPRSPGNQQEPGWVGEVNVSEEGKPQPLQPVRENSLQVTNFKQSEDRGGY